MRLPSPQSTDRLAQLIRTLAATHPTVAEALRTEANYFDEHQRRMQYPELREDGFLIGSGMVESACKPFRTRFNGPACAGVALVLCVCGPCGLPPASRLPPPTFFPLLA